ncbi:MAG: SGNH/GDSL hydrolase family protein [Bacteroidales bacterium]|nr:SGNH/GDSL hydrolase family protein [Bacteroidales bacterium]
MKKKILIISAFLIALCAAAFAWYSFYYKEIQIQASSVSGNFTNFRDTIPQTDTSKQNILLIGDSMAYSLMFRTKNYCDYNNHELHVVSWVSATSKTYAICDTLEYFVNLYKPTYIIFVIGANEMFAYNAKDRIKYFDKIIPQTHGIPTVWIGPPNWKEDTGINEVMMKKFGPKQFFLSKKLHYTRIEGDIAHPNRASSSMWMDSVSSWIMKKSCFPIRLETPKAANPAKVDFVRLVVTDINKV